MLEAAADRTEAIAAAVDITGEPNRSAPRRDPLASNSLATCWTLGQSGQPSPIEELVHPRPQSWSWSKWSAAGVTAIMSPWQCSSPTLARC